MITQFNEKGKIFTNIISKMPHPVIIQTQSHQIHGEIYIRPDERLKDELNTSEQFLAVTDAVVFDLENKELYHAHFLTLNRDQIIWMIPERDLVSPDELPEEGEE